MGKENLKQAYTAFEDCKLETPKFVQNIIPVKDPGYTHKPVWFMHGDTKSVRIADKTFNYIDYLEAYVGIDCYTYRNKDDIRMIRLRKEIEEAIAKASAKDTVPKKK